MRVKTWGAVVFSTALVASALINVNPAYAAEDGVVHATANAVPDQYVVVLKDSTSASANATKVAGNNKVITTYKHALNGFSVQASAKEAKKIAKDSRVEGVYQDGYVKVDDVNVNVNQAIPAPPDSPWGLNRIDQRTTPPNAAGTYTWVYSGANVHAYVIDTGILTSHTQFGNRAEFVFSATGIGQPGQDCHGHGTHVAGTIGGSTYGVAKNVLLRGVKVLNCGGSGTFGQVIEGVDYVTFHAKKPAVANMSLGGGFFSPLNTAVTNSINSGISYALSAGNSNDNACNYSPASTPAAITTGSTGNAFNVFSPISDNRSSFSNIGPCLDIFAPGAEIRSSFIGSNTAAATLNGTSMAAPHVAGVVANYLQKVPTASPTTVRNGLVNFATSNKVINPGPGSPNKLLYAGNIPTLSANASPEPITCTRNITVSGNLALQGVNLGGRTIEVWFDRSGFTPPAFKGTAVTNSLGNYSRVVSQANDGSWFTIFRGAPLIGSKQSTGDFVNCLNRS